MYAHSLGLCQGHESENFVSQEGCCPSKSSWMRDTFWIDLVLFQNVVLPENGVLAAKVTLAEFDQIVTIAEGGDDGSESRILLSEFRDGDILPCASDFLSHSDITAKMMNSIAKAMTNICRLVITMRL